ncbi:putative transporter [Colletotrichum viniferum]|nr:putative transporter [Colletotrichum viniferum]
MGSSTVFSHALAHAGRLTSAFGETTPTVIPKPKEGQQRKVDWRLIPILGILYSIAGLDRVNLSNARVAGMNQDLRFDVGNRYSIALLVFFITYFLFELPTTLVLRPIGPKILLNGLVFK